MNESKSILIRCDGSPEIGLGHVVRCLALADELRDAHGGRVTFAMRRGPIGVAMVTERKYPVLTPDPDAPSDEDGAWLGEVATRTGARAVVLDVRDDLTRGAVERLRARGTLIALVDDLSERRLAADLAFYPPVPQVGRADWSGFTGELHAGWEWVLLRREFSKPPGRPLKKCGTGASPVRITAGGGCATTVHGRPEDGHVIAPSPLQRAAGRIPNARPRVLVTMGGSDPAGLTLKAVAALDQVAGDFDSVVVIGRGFRYDKELAELLARARRRFQLRRDVAGMAALMAQSDLAVASFGVTAYELAAMGVPAVFLCLTPDHAESASAFVEAEIAVSLGVHERVAADALAGSVRELLADPVRRERMGRRARSLMDGRGAERVARLVAGRLD